MNTKSAVTSVKTTNMVPTKPVSYFDGSTIGLIGWSILAFILTTITLGLGYPWAICILIKWQTEHTVVDSQRLKFTGTGGGLFLKWLIWTLLIIVTLGIYGIFVRVDFEKWKVEHTVSRTEKSQKPPVKSKKALLIIIPLLMIAEIAGFIVLYNATSESFDWIPEIPMIDEFQKEKTVTAGTNSKVSITMPESMTALFDSDFSYANEDGIEVVKNKDGSYTYTMTKKRHNTLMKDMKQSLEKSANDIITANPYSDLIDVKHNDDFTEVYLYFDAPKDEDLFNEYLSNLGNMFDVFSITGLAIAIPYYQLFNGVNPDDIDTSYIYIIEATGDEFHRFNYSDFDDFSESVE